MTDRGQCAQFRLGFSVGSAVLGLLLSALVFADPSPSSFHAELSSSEAVAGTLILVTVYTEPGQTVTGTFEGIVLPFFDRSDLGAGVYSAALGIPYDRKGGPGSIQVSAGVSSKLTLPLTVLDGNYPSEILQVDSRRVNPTGKKDLIRIRKEQAEVGVIYRKVTLQKFWSGPFTLPIESLVTSPFGTKRIFNGQLKNFHPGMDLKAAMDTPVYTPAPGKVVLAKSLFYTGNTVMIDHGYGIVTLYAHLNLLKVKKGQLLGNHELLGFSGKTGRVSGPHLHWQAVVHRVKINPMGLTQVMR